MRHVLSRSVAAILFLSFVAGARGNDEVKAIVEKAIKAHGGKDALLKFEKKALYSRAKGTLHQFGGVELTTETKAQDPGKLKVVTETEIMGQKIVQIQVFNGDNIWMKVNNMDLDALITDDMKKEMKEQLHQEKLAGLVFLQDKTIETTPLGEVMVEGKPALGIRASAKGHRDVSLYFDKESGLLVKTEGRIMDIQTQKEVNQERILKDYKDQEGVKRPTKVVIKKDGEEFLDMEIIEVKFPDKFEDTEFEKP